MPRLLSLIIALGCLCHVVSAQELNFPESLPAEVKDWLGPQVWDHDSESPSVSLGEKGAFDDTHLLSPMVFRNGESFHMWYIGAQGSIAEREYQLGLAISQNGKRFEKSEQNPIFRFGDGKHSVLTPSLLRNLDGTPIKEHGKYRMWFSATDFDVSDQHTLHETTSTDGITWSEPSPVLLDGVYAPTILKVGDTYRLWYTDVSSDPWCFRHAESSDGRDWKVTDKPILTITQNWEQSRLFYPHVVKVDDVYLMWYGSYWSKRKHTTALGFAVSSDGIDWHKHPDNPVLMPREDREWESHYTTSESVIRMPDGSWRMWFATRKKPPFINKYFAIGTALWAGPSKQQSLEKSKKTKEETGKQSLHEQRALQRRQAFTDFQSEVEQDAKIERMPAPDPTKTAEFESWQKAARSRLCEVLGIPKTGGPLTPENRGTEDFGDIIAEKWVLQSEPGSKLPAVLWLPKTAQEKKLPAVVLTFGHGGSKSQLDYQYIGQLYAKLGIACLAIDPMGEEERNPKGGMGTREHDRKDLDARAWAVGRPIMGKLVFDTMRGVDYLCTRDDIDTTRIGVAGNSLGGAKASWMVALETRLRFGIISGWAYDDITLDSKFCTMKPGVKLRAMLTWPEFLSLAAPHCAVLIMNGDADVVIDKHGEGVAWRGTKKTVDEAAKVFTTIGSENIPEAWFEPDGGHRPYPAHPAALPFLLNHANPVGLSAELATDPPKLNFGRWGDANGLIYEKLYGTDLHLRGATVVEHGISYISPERLAVLNSDELGSSEFNLTGWLEYLEAE